MAEEERVEEEKPKKGIPKLPVKLLLNIAYIVGGLVIVVIVASIVAKAVKQPQIEFGPKPVEGKKPHPVLATYLVKEEFIAKLADEEEIHLVKTGEFRLAYDSKNKSLAGELEERQFEIRDLINTILMTKTSKDLSSEEGKEGFKREVIDRVNSLLESGQIEDVYVELIIQ